MNLIIFYFQQLERISWEIFSDMELKYINKKVADEVSCLTKHTRS